MHEFTFLPPPRLDHESIIASVSEAIEEFRTERFDEPLDLYTALFDSAQAAVNDLLELTTDLLRVREERSKIVGTPGYLEALRFVAGPFVSIDDMKVIADTSLSRRVLGSDPEAALRVVNTAMAGIDGRRFPWIEHGDEPTEAERLAAVVGTATLIATEKLRTLRRNAAKQAQERAVSEALDEVGFERIASPRRIRTLEDAPGPGQYCREVLFGGRKADLVVGLRDNRRMAIECKVSNSGTNSIKRVLNDAGAKATVWLDFFGSSQVVPACVLSGVFKPKTLIDAQSRGLTLFWAHRLDDLTGWVDRTRGG